MKVIILGGTLCGIEQALRLREERHEVLMVVESTYVGEDFAATWAGYGIHSQQKLLKRLQEAGIPLSSPVLPGKMKRTLIESLLQAGVEICYIHRALGIQIAAGKISGVLLGGKLGIRLESCDQLIDATLYHTASAAIWGMPLLIPAGAMASVRLEYRGDSFEGEARHLQEGVWLERGVLDEQHAYLTVEKCFEQSISLRQARQQLWQKAIAAAKKLGEDENVPQLEQLNALPHSIWCPALWADQVKFLHSHGIEQGMLVRGQLLEKAEDWHQLSSIQTKILVAGAGTAGIHAALAAAEKGSVPILVEFFAHPGGTRTMGGIQPLYYGNRNRIHQKVMTKIHAFSEAMGHKHRYSRYGSGETLLYWQEIEQRGIRYYPCTTVCAVRKENGRIEKVLCVGEEGAFVVQAQTILDATGDGDVACLAGIPVEMGNADTHMVQNYSHGNRSSGTAHDKPGADPDTMRPDLLHEWNRAIMQDNLDCADYDLVEMLTVRESNRILGRFRITMEDAARGRVEPDTLIEAYSTYDPHSRCMSLFGRLGIMPERANPRFVAIPYRALQAQEAYNLLVIGKAISMDQEAFNYYRMSADIITLAIAAGWIAAQADHLWDYDVSEIQEQMMAAGAIVRAPRKETWYENSAERIAAALIAGEESAFGEMVLSQWPEMESLLRQANVNGSCQRQEQMVRALLWYKDEGCIEAALQHYIQLDERIGALAYHDRASDGLLDGGIHDTLDDYWHANQYAVLLARAQAKEAIPAIANAMNRTILGGFYAPETVNYGSLRVDCLTNDNYDRMLSLAEAALLMPDKAFQHPLMHLLEIAKEGVCQCSNVYMHYLVLRLAHAALCVHVIEAQETVNQYACHTHGVLAEYAKQIMSEHAMYE